MTGVNVWGGLPGVVFGALLDPKTTPGCGWNIFDFRVADGGMNVVQPASWLRICAGKSEVAPDEQLLDFVADRIGIPMIDDQYGAVA